MSSILRGFKKSGTWFSTSTSYCLSTIMCMSAFLERLKASTPITSVFPHGGYDSPEVERIVEGNKKAHGSLLSQTSCDREVRGRQPDLGPKMWTL